MNKAAVLGKSLRVRGRVQGEGDLKVEGEVDGDVTVSGALELGPGSAVTGAAQAESAVVEGRLDGGIEARGPVAIRAGGSVTGDVIASAVSLEEGGHLRGRIDADFDLPEWLARR
ncbi:MAG: polymer-forming cytoskeletal protein [Myxococcota bacterium]